MATDFTTNYNLDKYTAADKPNLRDQYNAAMDKIDFALLSANQNATEAKTATGNFQAQLDLKATKAELNAVSEVLPVDQFSAQSTVKDALDAKANSSALNALATKTELQSEADDRASTDTALNSKIDAVKASMNRKALVLGNSYAIGTGSTGGQDGIYERIKGVFSESRLMWASGAGFLNYDGSHGNTFQVMMQTYAASYTEEVRATYTDIVIISAVGDDRGFVASGTTALHNAIALFTTTAKTLFPNATISIALCSANTYIGTGDVTPYTVWSVHSRFVASCSRLGIKYLGYVGQMISHNSGMFSSDSYHPNDTGYEYLSGAIINGLNGCNYSFDVFRECSIQLTNTNGNVTINGRLYSTDGKRVMLELAQKDISAQTTLASPLSVDLKTLQYVPFTMLPKKTGGNNLHRALMYEGTNMKGTIQIEIDTSTWILSLWLSGVTTTTVSANLNFSCNTFEIIAGK